MDPTNSTLYYHPTIHIWQSARKLSVASRGKTRSTNRPTFLKEDISLVSPPVHSNILPINIKEEPDETIHPIPHSYAQAHQTLTLPIKISLQEHFWSYQFYKRLIGPLHPLEREGLLIADAI
jgi:hypothetical protein